jgi:hypothetical protein
MEPTRQRPLLWPLAAALGIGIGVVAAESILFSLLTGRPLVFAADVAPINAIEAAAPFVVLALLRARLLPWLIGLALTLAAWGWLLFEGVSYQWHPDGSGADIGLGLIMIAAPIWITAPCLIAHAMQLRRRG